MNIAPDRGSAWWIRKWRAIAKTNLMNIALGRGSAWSNSSWQAVIKANYH